MPEITQPKPVLQMSAPTQQPAQTMTAEQPVRNRLRPAIPQHRFGRTIVHLRSLFTPSGRTPLLTRTLGRNPKLRCPCRCVVEEKAKPFAVDGTWKIHALRRALLMRAMDCLCRFGTCQASQFPMSGVRIHANSGIAAPHWLASNAVKCAARHAAGRTGCSSQPMRKAVGDVQYRWMLGHVGHDADWIPIAL
jgi:hypothetical protein